MAIPPPPYEQQPPAMTVGPPVVMNPPNKRLLAAGSILRMIGVIIAGIALIWLGIYIANPNAMFSSGNPTDTFSTFGAIIVVAAIGTIVTGIGWAMQTWGVGLVLTFDRR